MSQMMALMHPRVRSNVLINIGSWRAHRRSTGAAITRGAGRWPPATHKNSKAARKRVHISTMAYTRLTNTSAPSPSVGQSRRCPWLVVMPTSGPRTRRSLVATYRHAHERKFQQADQPSAPLQLLQPAKLELIVALVTKLA